jgi:DNA-binding response OmpR family regulator
MVVAGGRERPILVADDEPAIRETVAYILECEGYRVVAAANGEEALSAARRERPLAVLLDVNMPKRDGFSVCREMKADPDLSSVPVILLTALGQKRDEAAGLAAGADAYVTKPFDDELILRKLAELTRKGP